MRGVPARVKNLELYRANVVQRGEQELSAADVEDFAEEGVELIVMPEERVVKSDGRDVAEVDVALGYKDGTGFVIGSMKTAVSGDCDVMDLVNTIKTHYAPRMPFKGRLIQPVFMAEVVRSGHDRLRDTCRKFGVRLYARNGRSISMVQLRAATPIRMAIV